MPDHAEFAISKDMGVKGSNEWKKLNREMKILQAKKKAGGLLPKEKERLEYLLERFGGAVDVTRIRLSEDIQAEGPKTLTSDDHFATEISQELLDEAEDFKAEKAWDKDVKVEEAKFQATDSRQGKETFKQESLSPFAVDLTQDFKDEGFSEEPEEEDEAAEKRATFGKVNYAKEENFQEAGAVQGGDNPFAMSLDPALAGALGDFADSQGGGVPNRAAQDLVADYGDEFEEEEPTDFTARVDDSESEVQDLFERGDEQTSDDALSHGELTTHSAEEDEEADVDYDLMRSAMDYAEDAGLAEQEAEIWAVDEEGNELEAEDEDVEQEIPTRFGDAPEGFGVGTNDPGQSGSSGVLIPDPPAEPSGDMGVLIPDAPESSDGLGFDEEEEPTAVGEMPDEVDDIFGGAPEFTAEESISGISLEDQVPDMSGDDEVPDMSGDDDENYDVDLWVEPEEDPEFGGPAEGRDGYQPAALPDDDDGWAPEPSPMASGGDPGSAAPGDEMDSFWGLSDDQTEEPSAPTAATAEPTIMQDPFPDQSLPTGTVQGPGQAQTNDSKPLPALNLDAARVQSAPPKPDKAAERRAAIRQAASRPEPKLTGSDTGKADALLSSLFGEPAAKQSSSDDEDLEPIIIGPAKGKPNAESTGRRTVVGRGVSRQAATQANDLSGPRRATVHFKDGVNRRGMVHTIDTDSGVVDLHPNPGSDAPVERLNSLALKAIFLMLPRGVAYPEKQGYYCKAMMIDNRAIEGYTSDYDPARKAFTLFPTEDRGNIERIIVFNEAIKNLWFPEE